MSKAKPWEYVRLANGHVVADRAGNAYVENLIRQWWALHDLYISGWTEGEELYNKQVGFSVLLRLFLSDLLFDESDHDVVLAGHP